jgi:hypothetical protein
VEDIKPTKMFEEDTEEDAGTHEASDRYFSSPCHSNKALPTVPGAL